MAKRGLFLFCRRTCAIWSMSLTSHSKNLPRCGSLTLPTCPGRNHIPKRVTSLPTLDGSYSTAVSPSGYLDLTTSEDRELSREDWNKLKTGWKTDKRRKYMDFTAYLSIILKACGRHSKTTCAKSILDHARREADSLPLVLFNDYAHFCALFNDQEGLDWCLDEVRKEPSLLDAGNIRSLMGGVCKRETWKTDALELLKVREDNNVERTSRLFSPLIGVASRNKDVGLVSDILDEMVANDLILSNAACSAIFSHLVCNSQRNHLNDQCQELIFRLLEYIREKRHYISKEVALTLKNWFTSMKNTPWKPTVTRVSNDGKCKSCGHKLEKMTLTPSEFETLKTQVTEKVFFGADIFQKTRPDEFEAFTQFVKEGGPYDLVVDGLNISRLEQNRNPYQMLREVIVYLVQVCGYKCLVLGRHHMMRRHGSQSKHMDAVMDLADCFFTENISQDDPFMIYAALHSGPRCMFMTRDLLRDHKVLLDPEVHLSFVKWQRTHQIHPVSFTDNKLVCKPIWKHDTVVQSTPAGWHIPFYDEDVQRHSYHIPIDWLCVTNHVGWIFSNSKRKITL